MEKKKFVICLEDNDLILIEKIVIDRDKKEALKFVEKIKREIDKEEKSHCKVKF